MKRILSSVLFSSLVFGLIFGQTDTASFEGFALQGEEFINGHYVSGPFISGSVRLNNSYDADYDYWSGWAISHTSDQETRGYTNQYSAKTNIPGDNAYAVGYFSGEPMVIHFEGSSQELKSLDITTTVYSYWSMKEGDSFAKKFGGESGQDEDYFRAIFTGYYGGVAVGGVTFYLADYRSADDYIVDDWTRLDLPEWGALDSVLIQLESSDVSQFGINTPAYIALDNIVTRVPDILRLQALEQNPTISVFPNPTKDQVLISGKDITSIEIFDISGRLQLSTDQRNFTIGHLPSGLYIMRVTSDQKTETIKLRKE